VQVVCESGVERQDEQQRERGFEEWSPTISAERFGDRKRRKGNACTDETHGRRAGTNQRVGAGGENEYDGGELQQKDGILSSLIKPIDARQRKQVNRRMC
jgi:hypothetical protein